MPAVCAPVVQCVRMPDTRPQSPEAAYVDLDEAAAYYGVSVSLVRRMVADGRLPASRLGARIRIKRTDLDAALTPITPEDPQVTATDPYTSGPELPDAGTPR